MASEDLLKRINKTLKKETLAEDLRYLCELVKPQWRRGTFSYKQLKGGLVNDIYKCFVQGRENFALIVRVYGEDYLCNLIDHEKEVIGLQVAHAAGVSAQLHVIFNNGLVYDFAPGTPMRWGYFWDDRIARNYMRSLAKLHSVDLTKMVLLDLEGSEARVEKKYSFLHRLRETVRSVPEEYVNFPDRKKRVEEKFWSKARFLEEIDILEDLFSSFSFEVVFTHHDAWVNNVIYDKDTDMIEIQIEYALTCFQQDKITIIDFENADFNFEAFDLAMVFNCFQWFEMYHQLPGDLVQVSDEELKLPRDDKQKRKLAQMYWEEKCTILRSGQGDRDSQKFEAFYDQALMMEIFIFLYWAVFQMTQFDNKLVKYDIVGAAEYSFEGYLKQREKLLSLKI